MEVSVSLRKFKFLKTIPQSVQNILGLGNKFNMKVPNEKTPVAKIIPNLEPVIQNLPQTQERIELRNKLCNILTNHKKARQKKSALDVIINEQTVITKEFIKNNPDIVVLNADKGNVTVLKSNRYKKWGHFYKTERHM